MQSPLVVARMAVSNLGYGVTKPGQETPSSETVALQAAPEIATKSVPSGMFQITIADPEMMTKLKLGKSYLVLIVEDDGSQG